MSTPGVYQSVGDIMCAMEVFSTLEEYHEYTGGCSVHWGIIMSTLGGYQDACGVIMSTLGDV